MFLFQECGSEEKCFEGLRVSRKRSENTRVVSRCVAEIVTEGEGERLDFRGKCQKVGRPS